MQQAVPDSVQAADTTAEDLNLQDRISEASELVYQGRAQEGLDTLTEHLLSSIADHVPQLFGALIVLVVLYALYRLVYVILSRVLRRARYVRLGLETLALQAFRLLSLISIFVVVLGQMGLEVGTIIAGVGLAGIALGLAARDTLENILSGVSILADASFRIGDAVILQGTYGVVQEITLRSTRIRTRKNEILVVPNKIMANELVLNHSVESALRVELPFSIGYGEHPDEARETVLALTDDDERLREDESSRVVVTRLAESGVDLALWIYPKDPVLERELAYDYTERILEALREANIEIPYPHVHLKVDQPST